MLLPPLGKQTVAEKAGGRENGEEALTREPSPAPVGLLFCVPWLSSLGSNP